MRPYPVRHRKIRRTGAIISVLAAVLAVTVGVANAVDITSPGPLVTVTTSPDLNCAIMHDGDIDGAFFDDTACGTFVTDGTNLYGPASIPAGSGATSVTGYVPWSAESQTGPTGSGTLADPYKIVTQVSGGPFSVTQTDTYVTGQEVVRTDVQVTSSTATNAIVYRAADCYLQGSDSGLGRLDLGIAPTCVASPTSPSPDRILQFYPLTAGSNHIVDNYGTVWNAVGSKTPFPNTIQVDDGSGGTYDNGMGLSWSRALAAGATTTLSAMTVFSPLGIAPITVTKTATPSAVGPGGEVTYTITATNPGAVAIPVTAFVDNLPAGFTYVPGSTTGTTTADPTVSGNTLTWSGDWMAPGASGGSPGTLSLTFKATASMTAGTYTNSATVEAIRTQVIGAVDTAAVMVTTTTTTSTTVPDTTVPDTTVPDTTVPDTTVPDTTVPDTTIPETTTTVPETTTTVPETTTSTPVTVTLPPTTSTTIAVRPNRVAQAATAVAAQPAYTG